MVKVRVMVRLRVQIYLVFYPWRHSELFIWERYPEYRYYIADNSGYDIFLEKSVTHGTYENNYPHHGWTDLWIHWVVFEISKLKWKRTWFQNATRIKIRFDGILSCARFARAKWTVRNGAILAGIFHKRWCYTSWPFPQGTEKLECKFKTCMRSRWYLFISLRLNFILTLSISISWLV